MQSGAATAFAANLTFAIPLGKRRTLEGSTARVLGLAAVLRHDVYVHRRGFPQEAVNYGQI